MERTAFLDTHEQHDGDDSLSLTTRLLADQVQVEKSFRLDSLAWWLIAEMFLLAN